MLLFDQEVSDEKLEETKLNLPTWMAEHAAKIRSVLNMVGALTIYDIEEMTLIALAAPEFETDFERAEAALNVVMWHVMYKPLTHESREYKNFVTDRMLDWVNKFPETLQTYAIYILQEESSEIYHKLCDMHKPTADQYFRYALHRTAARQLDISLEWMTNW